MAEVNPPLVLKGGSHDSDVLRQLWEDTYTPGIIESGHLEVTERDTPALGVTVAAGRAFVAGSEASTQGLYYLVNDADVDVDLATADATNDRIDLVGCQVKDSFYSGAEDEWELVAVTGTPAASPSAPSAPDNFLTLAEVTVPADAGGNPAITNSDIEDKRVSSQLQSRSIPVVYGYALDNAGDTISTSETIEATATVEIPEDWNTYDLVATAGLRVLESGTVTGDRLVNLFLRADSLGGSILGLTIQRLGQSSPNDIEVATFHGFLTGETTTGSRQVHFTASLSGDSGQISWDDLRLSVEARRTS